MSFANNLAKLPKLDTTNTSRSFTAFSKLPLELRNMVWPHASNVPRKIAFTMTSNAQNTRIKNQRAIPAILHVSFKAREGAKKHYTIGIKHCIMHSCICSDQESQKIYINFTVDVFVHGRLRYRRSNVEYGFGTKVMQEIQHLELAYDLSDNNFKKVNLYSLFRDLRNLRTLTIILRWRGTFLGSNYEPVISLGRELEAKGCAENALKAFRVNKEGKTKSSLPVMRVKQVLELLRGAELGWRMEEVAEDVDLPPASAQENSQAWRCLLDM